jgi:DNA-binding CsgD family transcriptional regulator
MLKRNPHPQTLGEFERDLLVHGPLAPAEILSALRDLALRHIEEAQRRISRSRTVLDSPHAASPQRDRSVAGPPRDVASGDVGREEPAAQPLSTPTARLTPTRHLDRIGQDARLLQVLEQLLGLEATGLSTAMAQAAQWVADAVGADKVDVFFHVPDEEALIVEGVSNTPMARRQQALGLDRLPLANGGRTAQVFASGQAYRCDHSDEDPLELPAIVRKLGVRSTLAVPLGVGGIRRGVVLASSATPTAFTANDLAFLMAVARWIGLTSARIAHAEWLAGQAREQALRNGAGQLGLTPRQLEIAGLVRAGATNARIAQRLVLEEGTVANHVAGILQRLRFRNRAQIAAWATERGIAHSPAGRIR